MATTDDLPEPLLLHILSFLPTLDAIRTCLISSKWRSLWRSLSSLDFDFDFTLFPNPSDSLSQTCKSFVGFVNQTLAGRSDSRLHRFALRFYFTGEDNHYDQVVSWIAYAINHGVVELYLDFHGYPTHSESRTDCYYDFCLSALRDSRVRALKLRSCDCILPDGIFTADVISLRSIVLFDILLTDEIVSDLISGCVNLESLVLEDSFGLEDLKICSSKLKELSLWNFEDPEKVNSVEICAPNLCSLSIICFKMRKFSLEFSSSLVEASVVFSCKRKHFKYWSKVVTLLGGVKRLTVQNWWFELLQTKDALSEGFVFNSLIYLELQTGYTKTDMLGLAAFLDHSPKLQTLILDSDHDTDEDESLPAELLSRDINFSLPSLRQVSMKSFRATNSELFFMFLLKRQGLVFETVSNGSERVRNLIATAIS